MGTVKVNSITINSISGSAGYGPFRGNSKIVSVDLGLVPWTSNKMTAAFYGCANLTSVTNFPNNLTSLTGGVFSNCRNFDTISKLPDSITTVASGSWVDPPFNATKINNTNFLPNNVQNIAYCFYNCRNLSTVNYLPNSITNMTYTFEDCNNLTMVTCLPASCINYRQCFRGCSNLTNIPPIPIAAMDMSGAFYGCSNLTNIYICSTRVNQTSQCFLATSNPKNVYIPFNASLGIYTNTYNYFNTSYGAGQNGVTLKENPYFETYGDWWWCNYDGMIHRYFGSTTPLTIPNSINGKTTCIDGTNAFCTPPQLYSISGVTDLNLNNVIVRNTLRSFCSGCKDLVNITGLNIDNTIKDVADAFYNCQNLKTIPLLPNSITEMIYTFCNCRNFMSTPNIPTATINIQNAFTYCVNIPSMPSLPNSVVNMAGTFLGCTNLQMMTNIPENITNLCGTFYNCPLITGNIYIKSNQISDASDCFRPIGYTPLIKNVYIPFKNSDGTNSATYNSFTVAGYKTDGSYQNVYLKDLATL